MLTGLRERYRGTEGSSWKWSDSLPEIGRQRRKTAASAHGDPACFEAQHRAWHRISPKLLSIAGLPRPGIEKGWPRCLPSASPYAPSTRRRVEVGVGKGGSDPGWSHRSPNDDLAEDLATAQPTERPPAAAPDIRRAVRRPATSRRIVRRGRADRHGCPPPRSDRRRAGRCDRRLGRSAAGGR